MPAAGYVSPYVRRQRIIEKQRAQEAAKRMQIQREKALQMAPPSASATANTTTGDWNALTKTSGLFDPNVRKRDIFRLKARDPSEFSAAEKRAAAVSGEKGPNRREQVAEAIAEVLSDKSVRSIFHREASSGSINVPESVKNLRVSVEALRETHKGRTASSQPSPAGSSSSSTAHSPRGGLASFSRGTSPRSVGGGTPRSAHGKSKLWDHHDSPGHFSLSPRGVADAIEASTSPFDLSLVDDLGVEQEGFGLDVDAAVFVPPYPHQRQSETHEQMGNLVSALTGLVKQMEKRDGLGLDVFERTAVPKRALTGAAGALEESFVFAGNVGNVRDRGDQSIFPAGAGAGAGAAGGDLSPHKQQARQILSDRVTMHLRKEVPPVAASASSGTSSCSRPYTPLNDEEGGEGEGDAIAPNSMGAIRDMLLTKLQAVEQCHAVAVNLLLHEPLEESERSEVISIPTSTQPMGSAKTSSSSSSAVRSRSTSGAGQAKEAAAGYRSDAVKLELAVHAHSAPQYGWGETQATRIPGKHAGHHDLQFACAHGTDERADVIQYTQKFEIPKQYVPNAAALKRRSSVTGIGGTAEEDEEVAEYERRQTAHFSGRELRAPCYSSTHETALRANTISHDTSGAAKEFGARKNAINPLAAHEKPIESLDYKLLAMRERRRVAMTHLPKLPSPASVTQDYLEWKKQMRFARDMRNMALESRGISFNYYLDRATEMVVSDVVLKVAEEVEQALDDEAARFVTKI